MRARRSLLANTLYVLPAMILVALFVYYPLVANLVYSFFSFSAGSGEMTPVGTANIARLFQLWEQGKIQPRVTGTYSLADGGKAIAKLGDRSAVGKLVVTV